MMRRFLAVSLVALAVAGCVGPPQAPEPAPPAPIVRPTPRPTTPPPTPLAADWNDWPFTPGDWAYSQTRHDKIANFADRVWISCNPVSRQITIGGFANAPVTVRTTSMTRSLAVVAFDQFPNKGAARLSADDPLLDAIAFSRGRFVIEQAGQSPLVLPPHAEIGRVIEDCRG